MPITIDSKIIKNVPDVSYHQEEAAKLELGCSRWLAVLQDVGVVLLKDFRSDPTGVEAERTLRAGLRILTCDADRLAGALTDLKRHGVTTLVSRAFSVGQPGQLINNTAADTFLRQDIVNIAIAVHDTNIVRRWIFEAHTHTHTEGRLSPQEGTAAKRAHGSSETFSGMNLSDWRV